MERMERDKPKTINRSGVYIYNNIVLFVKKVIFDDFYHLVYLRILFQHQYPTLYKM